MALKLVRPGPVVVSGTKGSYKPAAGSSPPGWAVWGSDGRIIPPPGLYRVTTTGITVRKRTTDGNFVAVGDLVRIADGEAITPDYRNSEDVVMIEKVIPPPCFLGFLLRWVGGCRGAKTHQAGQYSNGGFGHAHGEWVGAAHHRVRFAGVAKQAVSRGLGSPRARCPNVPAPRLAARGLEDRHRYPSLEDHPRARRVDARLGILAGTGREVHAGAHSAVAAQGVSA